MTVELHELRGDRPADTVVGTVDLAEDGNVTIRADAGTTAFLRSYQVVVGGQRVGIEAGAAWVDALPENLRGSRLWAQQAAPTTGGLIGTDLFAAMSPDEQDAALGPELAAKVRDGDLPLDTALREIVQNHGELGPILVAPPVETS